MFDENKVNQFIDSIRDKLNSMQANFENVDIDKFNGRTIDWQSKMLYVPFKPKIPLKGFEVNGFNIFMSKKKPLLVKVEPENSKT